MRYDNLLLHKTSRKLLDAYLNTPTHGLLISGAVGSGTGTIARSIAVEIVEHATDISLIEPDDKNTISIETVRDLYVLTRDKKTKTQVVLIDGVDSMSLDAQHAFLKLLEEPNHLTKFILTAHQASKMISTIMSRLQHIPLRPISYTDSSDLAQRLNYDDIQKTKQVIFVANGLPAEIARLSNDKAYFETKSSLVFDARILINGSTYEKLLLIPRYSDRTEAYRLVATLGHLVEFMLQKQPDKRLYRLSKSVEVVAKSLRANGHIRTQLMRLAIVG